MGKDKVLDNGVIDRRFNIIRTMMAIVISLLVSMALIFLVSEEPGEAIFQLLFSPFQKSRNFLQVLQNFVPLTFTGLAIAVMFSANQFNMAAEGSFYMGGVMASVIACKLALPLGIHPLLAIFIAGMVGSFVCVIPGLFKVNWGANEIVSSLMLNYVILYVGRYVLGHFLLDPLAGYPASTRFPETVTLHSFPFLFGIHSGIFMAILAIVLVWYLMERTKWGYEIRLTGSNEKFAKYSGINVSAVIVIAQAIGGFLAGAGGGIQALGMYERFSWVNLMGTGFDGIIIAILAKNNPKFIPLAVFFLSYLRVGAEIMSRRTDVTIELVAVVQAMIILFVGAKMFLQRYRHQMIVRNSKKKILKEDC